MQRTKTERSESKRSWQLLQEAQIKWETLGISNDFLFGKVMQNPELCIELLQRILPDLRIDHIEYPELQKEINCDIDARSVRLDVYVKDDKEAVYDIEIQVSDTKEIPKRSRYYQSMIDLQLIDRGQHYIKIFLNAKGVLKDVSRELQAFLDYIAGQKTTDSYVEKLEIALKGAKKNRRWRHEYMTLLMRDQENMEKGREEGREEGREQGILGMISALRDLSIPDNMILQKLQEKFFLSKEESQNYLRM